MSLQINLGLRASASDYGLEIEFYSAEDWREGSIASVVVTEDMMREAFPGLFPQVQPKREDDDAWGI